MSLITVFANFFIDTEERFLRMKDSSLSFIDINADKWVINVRGRYCENAFNFLQEQLGSRLVAYRLQSKEGWFHDTRQMLDDIDGDYVLFWLEDHINQVPVHLLESIIQEMKENDLDSLLYTFWQFGHVRKRYQGVELEAGRNLDWFVHTVKNNEVIQQNVGGSYVLSAASFLKQSLFKNVVMTDDPVPKRWPVETPFDFEKAPGDIHWLPLRVGLAKQELFASIDDDHGCENYCLQSRGLYPIREKRKSYTQENDISLMKRMKKSVGVFIYYCIFSFSLLLGNQRKHFFRWIISNRKNYMINASLPWITYDALDFINDKLKNNSHVFEFGSGGSTLFFLKKKCNVVSIEHDNSYYMQVKNKIDAYSNIDYRLVESNESDFSELDFSDPVCYASSDSLFKGSHFKEYVTQIDHFEDESFDLVLIDGRARPSCIMHSCLKVKIGGMLVVDNSDRGYYFEKTEEYLKNYQRHTFAGATPSLPWFTETTVFKRIK